MKINAEFRKNKTISNIGELVNTLLTTERNEFFKNFPNYLLQVPKMTNLKNKKKHRKSYTENIVTSPKFFGYHAQTLYLSGFYQKNA